MTDSPVRSSRLKTYYKADLLEREKRIRARLDAERSSLQQRSVLAIEWALRRYDEAMARLAKRRKETYRQMELRFATDHLLAAELALSNGEGN